MKQIEAFRLLVKKQKAYEYAMAIVGWDSETEAPKGAFNRRSEMQGVLSSEYFKLVTHPETIEIIETLFAQKDVLDPMLSREVQKAKKALDKIIKIPESEFIDYQKLLVIAQRTWEEAKAQSNYDLFKDTLAKIVAYNKKFVHYFQPDEHPYNVMLDDYEEGMSMREYDRFFDQLKRDLVPFVKEVIEAAKDVRRDFVFLKYKEADQYRFCDYLIDELGFDRNHGLMKKSVHPFTWNTSPDDVRFTTRYMEDYGLSSIYSVIHELGHALYEQHIDTVWDDTLLTQGTSMGIHESQSRLFENTFGRSRAFWERHFPKFASIFPEQTKNIRLEDMYMAVNHVEASLIRVEADELTYPLHIMIRYEIERQLMNGEISCDDLPRIWNEKMVEYLGIEPKDDAEGVLQDVHWSGGMIGYFPTYALGSAYAAQFYHVMQKELPIDDLIREGSFDQINQWLKEKIHRHGSSKSPRELLIDVTGKDFDPEEYITYLKDKYTKLYLE
jgi:carboxypeptidase Taq